MGIPAVVEGRLAPSTKLHRPAHSLDETDQLMTSRVALAKTHGHKVGDLAYAAR